MLKKRLLLFILLWLNPAFAQQVPLSDSAEISILTIGPGKQLYDSFGHNAFRVKDITHNIDVIYNYGTYDFNTPNFYGKFAQGKLLYQLTVNDYQPFYDYYSGQNRWIKEQNLNLTIEQKQAVFEYLQNNARPENKNYLYDFLYDNCATQMRDVLVNVLGDDLVYSDEYIKEQFTFRQLIQKNVHWNTWGSVGMDIAIGAVVDKKASAWEYQFLPQYIFEAAEIAILKNGDAPINLVKESKTIFANRKLKSNANYFLSPLFVFSFVGLLIIFITVKDSRSGLRTRSLDGLIYYITGLAGLILLLLWVATEHSTTANNFNLLWALPVSLIFGISAFRKQPSTFFRTYVILQLLLLILLCIVWITGVQTFAYALTPLLIALAIRYTYLIKTL